MMHYIEGCPIPSSMMNEFIEMRNNQPVSDRMKYLDTAFESINNPNTRVLIIQKLYADLIKHGDIDFGPIPKSKGDLTRYEHYKLIVDTMKAMDNLLSQTGSQEYEVTEKLFNMIIECRSDFEYGFKFDIELIKLSYNVLVMSLHHMIDISIMKYVDSIKQTSGLNFASNTKSTDRLIIYQSVKSILKSYDKGEWTEMINSFKKGRCNWLGSVGAAAKAVGLITPAGLTPVGVSVVLILGLITIVIGFRKLVYLFYSSAYKINDSVQRSKSFLQFTIEKNPNQTPQAIARQKKLLAFFEKIHDVIEIKVFGDNDKAVKKLAESDKANFSMSEMRFDNFDNAKFEPTEVPPENNINPPEDTSGSSSDISFF